MPLLLVLMLHFMCVESNCHYFLFFIFVLFLLVPVLFACSTIAHDVMNKDEYIMMNISPNAFLPNKPHQIHARAAAVADQR